MAEHLEPSHTLASLLASLREPDAFRADPFGRLKAIAAICADTESDPEIGRQLVIRSLEHRDDYPELAELFSALARQVGLYPYADPLSLSVADLVALEAQRPLAMPDVVLHEEQGYVYRTLLEGRNVILSASTSFGKSLLIDAIVMAGNFRNIAVVVPTIALLDETRRRLARLPGYKVVTHPSQRPAERNIFVMTQERLLDYPDLPPIDFFALDEFYKLDVQMDAGRASLLNQIFYKLMRAGGQFYLLGPGVESVTPADRMEATFISTPFRTVAIDVLHVAPVPDSRTALVALCHSLDEPTLIFTRSPARAREVAGWLSEEAGTEADADALSFSDWISATYHPEWVVGTALRRSVGIHHGRLPRALGHHMVRLFNAGGLRFLVCTSTLIEGVNTAAKNVVVFDNTIAQRQLDLFTFNNIRGRSGRMFRHFVGRVFSFFPEPDVALPNVDVAILSQPADAPLEMIVQLEPDDWSAESQRRLAPFTDNPYLSFEVFKANGGVDLEAQVEVAKLLTENPTRWSSVLDWRGPYPDWGHLEPTCALIWELAGPSLPRTSARSPRQLALLLSRLSASAGRVGPLISSQLDYRPDPSEAVEFVLDFVRTWPGHHLPRLLFALQRIAEEVLAPHGLPIGDFSSYAARAEHLFLPPYAAALEEYGLPAETALRIPGLLAGADDLDQVLAKVGRLPTSRLGLSAAETAMLIDVKASLPSP